VFAGQGRLAPDVSYTKIVSVPVSGKLGGHPFVPTRVEWQPLGLSTVSLGGKVVDKTRQHTLSFRVGDDFIPDHEIKLWISFDDGKPLAPRTWHWRPTAFNTEAYRKQSYPVSRSGGSVARGITGVHTTADNGQFMEGYSARLEFLRVEKGTLIGRIGLILPDGRMSYLNGHFRAKILPRLSVN